MKANNFQDMDKDVKLGKVKEKFNQIREYAKANGWLFIEDFKENDEEYPRFVCLTQSGMTVEILMDEDSINVDNSTDEFDVEL